MVRNNIKVYARIKDERNKEASARYDISTKKQHDYLIVKNPVFSEECPKGTYKFRFENVFDQDSSQLEVFETIAKPIVNSVLSGYNGTIFAYGQTGSGKTYAITGSSKEYNHRGIIPRSIEHIFDHAEKNPHRYTMYISYLEIYNEAGYDLLSVKHRHSSRAEDLPRVVLLADGKGDYHLRNLSIHPVATVQEAMGLLFMGDANRTIVETPMNDTSSRSHCIFTVYMSSLGLEGVIRRSKLNLVDLAGSERVYKSRVIGHTLTEAKYINLSLHYLEQVIVALSEAKRPHIPFRNSMMTFMLKDSLSGNCLTSMLTTVSINVRDIAETISTCKFAQRVSLVNTEPTINEEVDMQQQLDFLRRENEELRRQLLSFRGVANQEQKDSGPADEQYCKQEVHKFLEDSTNSSILNVYNPNEVMVCFNLMKQMYLREKSYRKKSNTAENAGKEIINKYKKIMHQKDDEILVLNELVETFSKGSTTSLKLPKETSAKAAEESISQDELFQAFASDPKNRQEIDRFNNAIQAEFSTAKKLSEVIERYRKEIRDLKQQLGDDAVTYDEKSKVEMNTDLMRLVGAYLQTLLKIKNIKLTTDELKQGLELAQKKLREKFKECIQKKCGSKKVPQKKIYTASKEDSFIVDVRENDLKRSVSSGRLTGISGITSTDSVSLFVYDDLADISPTKDSAPNIYQASSRSTMCGSEQRLNCGKDYAASLHVDELDPAADSHEDVGCIEEAVVKGVTFMAHTVSEAVNCVSSGILKANQSVADVEKEVLCENLSSCSLASSSRPKPAKRGKFCEDKDISSGLIEKNATIETAMLETNLWQGNTSGEKQHRKESKRTRARTKPYPKNRDPHSVHQDNPIQELIDLESQPTQVSEQDLLHETSDGAKVQTSGKRPGSVQCSSVSCTEKDTDTEEFKDFMKTVPLTGDPEVDDEIYSFYRDKFKC